PAAAYLMTDSLPRLLVYSALIAAASPIAGFWLAWVADANIAGAMAAMTGVAFLLAFLFSAERGMVAVARRRARQKLEFAQLMLAVHLLQHEDSPDAASESAPEHLQEHLQWTPEFARRIVERAERGGGVGRRADRLVWTAEGGARAAAALGAVG